MAKNWQVDKKRIYGAGSSPVSDPDLVEDMDRKPSVTGGMKVPGGKATSMKVAGQNTGQPGTGVSRQRNFLGHRVT